MSANDQYLRDLEDNYLSGLETVKVKSQDYAMPDDPFWNFRFAAQVQDTTVARAILGRIGEKLGRIINLLSKEDLGQGGSAVEDETMEDTLRDLMNMVNILCVYRQWQQKPVEGYLYSGEEQDYAFDPNNVEYVEEEDEPIEDPDAPQNRPAPGLAEIDSLAPPSAVETARERFRSLLGLNRKNS